MRTWSENNGNRLLEMLKEFHEQDTPFNYEIRIKFSSLILTVKDY
jgi:hypothetical protein